MKSLHLTAACVLAAPLIACQAVAAPIAVAGAHMTADVTTKIGRAVTINRMTIRPVKVVEDSRCPANVRCVWAGRLVVLTEVGAPRGGEQLRLNLELGKPVELYGGRLTVLQARPAKRAATPVRQSDYRFTYRFER